jgi:hypothetical protein
MPSENGVAARDALRTWILGKNKELDPDRLTDSTPLFAERYLRSIHLPELILLVERLRGGAVDVSDLTAGHFRDIDTIVNLFINSEPS